MNEEKTPELVLDEAERAIIQAVRERREMVIFMPGQRFFLMNFEDYYRFRGFIEEDIFGTAENPTCLRLLQTWKKAKEKVAEDATNTN